MPGRTTSMAELAAIAGVSITTVSHVLNETRFVADDTRRRVLAAVDATGYVPNRPARSIATRRTGTVGLALSALSTPAFADLVRPIEQAISSGGDGMLLADTADDPVRELAVLRNLHQLRVDGLLLAPARPDGPALDYLRRSEIPAVLIDRFARHAAFDQVGTENLRAMTELTGHLLGHGHRRIALVLGNPDLSTTAERRSGFVQALAEAGLRGDPKLIKAGGGEPLGTAAVVRRMMRLKQPPTAIVAGNNTTTVALVRALRDLGLRVPADVAVAGFDDFDWAGAFEPRLTVVRQAAEAIGTTAVRLLRARIADPGRPVETHRIDAGVVVRSSCGCPAQ